MPRNDLIQVRAGTTAQWDAADVASAADPTRLLAANELGRNTETGEVKAGDGATKFADLPAYLDATGISASYAGIASLPINVRDPQYGAVGDGITDDTTAIQAAITASGGEVEVLVSRGTYLVRTLTSAAGLLLTLEEGATLKLKSATNAALVSVTDGPRVRIKGGTFDGNKASNTHAAGLINIASVDEVDIDTRVDTSGGSGVRVSGASRGLLTPTVLDVAGHAVQVIDSSNVTVRATVDGADQCGAIVSPATVDCTNITVEGVYRNVARSGTPHIGIYFNSGDPLIVKRSRISAQVENAGFVGIFPGGDDNTVTSWSVDGSGTVSAASAHGLWVHDSARITVGPGVVRNSARSGVAINKSHAVAVTGVTSANNGNAGFLLSRDDGATSRYQGTATNKDVTVSGCVAVNNSQAGANTWPGFYIDGYQSLSITGCQAHDYQGVKTQSRGLVAATNVLTQDVSIVGNNFRDNLSGNGISIAAAYLSMCYGNTPNDSTFVATGTAQLAVGATDGFHYAPKIAGTPTGTPTAKAGGWPMAFDATAAKLWLYNGTAWKGVGLRTRVFSGSAALDFPSIAAGATAELTITVTGAAVGDIVTVSPSGAPVAGLMWAGYVSATDTVTVRLSNVTSGAIDPVSRTYVVETRSPS